jgi:hypothetical protein
MPATQFAPGLGVSGKKIYRLNVGFGSKADLHSLA